MDRTRDFNQRKAYVETILANMLKVKPDFDFIKYARALKTEEDYVRIGDLRGCSVTFNVTGSPLAEIMEIVCDYVVTGPSGNIALRHIVADSQKLLSIAPLFREVA